MTCIVYTSMRFIVRGKPYSWIYSLDSCLSCWWSQFSQTTENGGLSFLLQKKTVVLEKGGKKPTIRSLSNNDLLRPFAQSWKFDRFQTLRNNSQQHATTCNRVCKQTQHVTSNIFGSCWLTMLRPFARDLTTATPVKASLKTLFRVLSIFFSIFPIRSVF